MKHLTCALILLAGVCAAPAAVTITVDPGAAARTNSPITASVDFAMTSETRELRSRTGAQPILVQVHPTANGSILRWVQPKLDANKPLEYELHPIEQSGAVFNSAD